MLHACRGECRPPGVFVLVFSAHSSKVRFILGSEMRTKS